MCDACDGRVKHGLSALEALANGEDVPEAPEINGVADLARTLTEHKPTFALPFPVIAFETDSGNVGILTDEAGWDFFKKALEQLGKLYGGQ